MLTVALVVMVIFLFLRNVSATIIPSVAVPLSLVGTFGVMYLLGYSLNNLTLMALTISTGFVVDDAIVMIENIVALYRRGRAAAAGGAQGRRADRIHHRFADRFADRGADSAAVHGRYRGPAVPRIRRHAGGDHSGLGGGFADADADDVLAPAEAQARSAAGALLPGSERAFEAMIAFYGRTLKCGAAASDRTLLVAVGTLALTAALYHRHPQGLLPRAGYRRDSGHFGSGADRFPSRHGEQQQELAKVILKDPAVESLSSFIGIDGTNTTLNSGRILINLKPLEEREISASDVIRRLQPELAKVAGITLFMQPVQDLTVEDRVSRTQFQYTLEDPDSAS